MGMLNALHRFFMPATSPAMFNVVFIAGTVVLVPLFRRWASSRSWRCRSACCSAGWRRSLVQWPALRREGYRHQWILNPRDPALREVLLLMGPGTIGVAAAQINLFVNTSLATAVDGAPAALGTRFG